MMKAQVNPMPMGVSIAVGELQRCHYRPDGKFNFPGTGIYNLGVPFVSYETIYLNNIKVIPGEDSS